MHRLANTPIDPFSQSYLQTAVIFAARIAVLMATTLAFGLIGALWNLGAFELTVILETVLPVAGLLAIMLVVQQIWQQSETVRHRLRTRSRILVTTRSSSSYFCTGVWVRFGHIVRCLTIPVRRNQFISMELRESPVSNLFKGSLISNVAILQDEVSATLVRLAAACRSLTLRISNTHGFEMNDFDVKSELLELLLATQDYLLRTSAYFAVRTDTSNAMFEVSHVIGIRDELLSMLNSWSLFAPESDTSLVQVRSIVSQVEEAMRLEQISMVRQKSGVELLRRLRNKFTPQIFNRANQEGDNKFPDYQLLDNLQRIDISVDLPEMHAGRVRQTVSEHASLVVGRSRTLESSYKIGLLDEFALRQALFETYLSLFDLAARTRFCTADRDNKVQALASIAKFLNELAPAVSDPSVLNFSPEFVRDTLYFVETHSDEIHRRIEKMLESGEFESARLWHAL